jgi:hypothetical protein
MLYTALALAMLGTASVLVVMATFNLNVTSPVVVGQPAAITSAMSGADTCTVSADTLSASCPTESLTVGGSYILAVTVQNNQGTPSSPTITPTSGNSAVATVSASAGNPASVAAHGSATFDFTVTGAGPGSTTINVGISG